MSANSRAQQSLAHRLATVLRLYEHESDDVGLHRLADTVHETPRDLRRWASGTTLPGHVLSLLLGALPEHLANKLIAPTGRQLIKQDYGDGCNALSVASQMSALSSNIAARHADGIFCHVDQAQTRAEAQRLLPMLHELAREPGDQED